MTDEVVLALERPSPRLLNYYLLSSFALGPLFPLLMIPRIFRYRSMRFSFDAEGVSLRWGILFRHEISLTYARIQDIHLVSNVLERWLGLARVQVQTASGSSGAEMTLEGIEEFELVRDFLYARMRGVRSSERASLPGVPLGSGGDLVTALREVTEALKETREALERERQKS